MRSSAALFVGAMLTFLASALLPGSAQADVRVTFINSYYYSDLSGKPPDKREATLSEVRKAFVDLGGHFIKPGQILKIEVLDMQRIKLPSSDSAAGSAHASKTETQPLRLEIQYALQQGGKTLVQSRDSISDASYLANPIPPEAKKDRGFIHVKEMVRDWYTSTFGDSAPDLQ